MSSFGFVEYGSGTYGGLDFEADDAPFIVSCQAIDSRTLRIRWSEPVVQAQAEDAGNYELSGPFSPVVLTVTKQADQSYILITTEMDRNEPYILRARNILDLEGTPA